MAQANLPISYWGDALLSAAYILNHVPFKLVSSIPSELWTGRKLDLNELQSWGSTAYILDNFHKFGKLGPRGKKCIFIRYSENSKGYVFIGEDSDGRMTEIESRDVTFLENHFPTWDDVDKDRHLFELDDNDVTGTSQHMVDTQNVVPSPILDSGSIPELLYPSQLSGRDNIENDPISISESSTSQLCRSTRFKTPKMHFPIENEVYIVTPNDDDEEPKTVKEALECPAKEKWKVALEEEMESMKMNQVWNLVDLPLG